MRRDLHQSPALLVIEDSDEDFEALIRIINQVSIVSISVHRCIDGDDALDFLNRQGEYHNAGDISYPELIILDLNLPGTDGREVLATIKQSETLKTIPVVVLSTSSNPKDIAVCYQSGCNSYMVKSINNNELRDSVRMMLYYWFKATVLPTSAALIPIIEMLHHSCFMQASQALDCWM
jgi:CheY-like chemotaxis protein